MTTPLVSLIIPTCNRRKLLKRAINSVLKQTLSDWELIVVDDASRQSPKKTVKSFKDKRIKFISHKKNQGSSATKNSGLKIAQGKFIAILEDDDKWYRQKLEKQINLFKQLPSDVGLVYSGYRVILNNKFIINKKIPSLKGNLFKKLLKRNKIGNPTPLVRKECFQKVGLFDQSLPACRDWEMWLRISRHYRFDFLPDILAEYHIHGKQVSVNLKKRITAHKKIIKKYFKDFRQYPAILSYHYHQLGEFYSLISNFKAGQKYFCKSIKQNPWQKSSYFHSLFSFFSPHFYQDFLIKKCYKKDILVKCSLADNPEEEIKKFINTHEFKTLS